jgi:RNA polymerase sigma factor (sigma-70 family)
VFPSGLAPCRTLEAERRRRHLDASDRLQSVYRPDPGSPIDPLDPPSNERPVDQRIQDTDIARRVGLALATLPERQRGAIVLVHYQEMAARDAAMIMEISVEALEALLSRDRRALRAALAPEAADLIGVDA